MLGDMTERQEKDLLGFMTKITSIKKLDNLLDTVVEELPLLVGAIGCWIYLEPEYLSGLQDSLIRGNKKYSEDEIDQMHDRFIVLAATNVESKNELLRKAFFGIGEGITGWVYKNGKTLRINDIRDQEELLSISNELKWANEYNDGDEFYASFPAEKRPLLAVPLILDGKPIGTLKFHATVDKKPYSEISEKIATIAANIIAGILRQTWLISEQNETITRLIEMSNKNSYLDVISGVTKSLKKMLSCSRSEFYLKGESGETLHLIMRDGIPQENSALFQSGQSLIGWVYKTGLPLAIDNIKRFATRVRLNDELLDQISSGHGKINDEDRYLVCEEGFSFFGATGKLPTLSLMAIPVKSVNGEVEGVLCSYWNNPFKMQLANDASQLLLAQSFANTIALSLENKKQRDIGELLKDLGYITQYDQLFKTVVDGIPALVSSSGCSIFELVQNRGKSQLKLRYTSRKRLIHSSTVTPDIVYELGEGKTGMCGYTQCVVIVNHFGSGELSDAKLNLEYDRVHETYSKDVIKIVSDSKGKKIGLAQLQSVGVLSLPEKIKFLAMANTITFDEKGLVSSKLEKYSADKTWSFIAVPIVADHKLLGVITLARPTPNTPFSTSDVELIKSISGRLASYMSNLQTLENYKKLVMTLAHEINTPLIGTMADSENIFEECSPGSDLQKMAKHNLEQVLRLAMQTSTIMSVLSEQNLERQFSEHSIYERLIEACELFASEAAQKGCDILEPRAREGVFPKIEMSLFDMTIAIKNIVHNAVKYSFKPPSNMDRHRTIKLWGQQSKEKKGYYDIFVQNYGVEITQSEIESRAIFKPFRRGEKASDKQRIGAGFGLAHALMVIEDLHKGSIDVTSTHKGGDAYLTTFKISLPIKHPK